MTFSIPVKVASVSSVNGQQARPRSWQWTPTTPQGSFEGCYVAPVTRSWGTYEMTRTLFTVQVHISATRLLSQSSER